MNRKRKIVFDIWSDMPDSESDSTQATMGADILRAREPARPLSPDDTLLGSESSEGPTSTNPANESTATAMMTPPPDNADNDNSDLKVDPLLYTMINKAQSDYNHLRTTTCPREEFNSLRDDFLSACREGLNGIKDKMDEKQNLINHLNSEIDCERRFFASLPWGYESASIARMNVFADRREAARKVAEEYKRGWRELYAVREKVRGLKYIYLKRDRYEERELNRLVGPAGRDGWIKLPRGEGYRTAPARDWY